VIRAPCCILFLMNQSFIASTPDQIFAYRLLALRAGLKLEILGMRLSRGEKASKMIRHLMSTRTRNLKELLSEYESFLRSNGFLQA
jgi:hypothetical protein